MNELQQDEHQVRELFRAAAGWSGLAKMLEHYGCGRASRFCRRRWRAVDARAVQLLHELMAE